jgi:hypothetical protein
MKIIRTDNYDRDSRSDKLIAENIAEFYAREIVAFLNEKVASHEDFFKAVPDDYKLYTFEL